MRFYIKCEQCDGSKLFWAVTLRCNSTNITEHSAKCSRNIFYNVLLYNTFWFDWGGKSTWNENQLEHHAVSEWIKIKNTIIKIYLIFA